MIIGSLTQTKRFEILHPDFKKVFEYVRSGDWQQVTAGKIILEEDKIWVNVDEVTGKSREAAKLEAHNRFIDIQIPLLQEETFGWEERGRLAMEEEEGYQVLSGTACFVFYAAGWRLCDLFPGRCSCSLHRER